MSENKKLIYSYQSNETTLSLKQIVLLGFLAFFIFACIENIISLSTLGLYWQYYILSMVLWLGLSIMFNFSFLGIYIAVKKISQKSWLKLKKTNSNPILILTFFLFFPHLLYTTIQVIMRMPHKYYLIPNLGVIFIILLVFFPILKYTYCFLKNQKKNIICNFILIIILSGFSSIFGVLLLGSEFQKEEWLVAILVMIIFNIFVPFLLVFILKLSRNFTMPAKSIMAIGLLISLVFFGNALINLVLESLVFNRQDTRNSNKSQVLIENLPNIILIIMDTTRAGNMSLYGYKRLTTPNLQKFSKDAVVFKNAISSAPWILPSHASLFTGLRPYIHSATHGKTVDKMHIPLGEEFDTLSEILSLNGYKTGAVVANSGCLSPWHGLNQGFSYYWWGRSRKLCLLFTITIKIANKLFTTDTIEHLKRKCGIDFLNNARRINQISIDWILRNNKKNRPLFLFINYMETHGMSYLPSPYSCMFTSPPMPNWGGERELDEKTGIPKNLDKKFLSKVRAWYDNELAYLDYEIGRLILKLKEKKVYDSTLIIVTSDHGELLGEHEYFGHEYWLYQELVHVPLIVKYPGGKRRGEVIHKAVQNIDIFAEILDQVGIALPTDIEGQPFDEVDHPIFSEVYKIPSFAEKWPLRYNQDLKTIFSRELDFFKLINSDSELDQYLNSLISLKKKILKKENVKPKKLDKATIDRLKTLGYIE